MDIFQFIDRTKSEPCLMGNELYLIEGKWFRLDKIQFCPLDVTYLKTRFGDHFCLSIHFVGKIVIKAGVNAEGKSFVWCGEKTLESRTAEKGTCHIDLSKVQSGTLEISFLALKESTIFDNSPAAVEKDVNPEHVLYDFLSPTYELCCEEPLYYRFVGEQAYYSFEDRKVYLKKKSSVDLLTYFNAFSAVKWKKYTNVEHLSTYLDFEGEAIAEAIHISEHGERVLASWKLKADHRVTLELPLGEYPDVGIIGLRIHAERECVLHGGGYLTDAPVTQSVHLGIGITTYRREDAVKASVARLGKAIAEHPLYHNAIDITVVDNGQTLVPEDVPAATLIPNKNLGGTGGFMRSLIYYQDEGTYTHCLFMDDDASCEAGSLFRSMSFMRHALDLKLALSGAMLFENIQFLQWENGAWFDGGCHSLNRNLDLRVPQNLHINETESTQQIYGAWFWSKLYILRQIPAPNLTLKGIKKWIVRTICWTTHYTMKILCISPRWLYRQYKKYADAYNHEDTEYIKLLDYTYPTKYMMKRRDVFPTVKMNFENIQVEMPNNYDKVLSDIFGNYMELPPVEKRKNHYPHLLCLGNENERTES